jgi:uncharacterized protein with ParB-like and HNH nuclease domain/alkylated DNA nucleotide flippase Atl1
MSSQKGEFGVMDVAESTLKAILEGSKQYRVPLYQRPYAWKKANLRKLWDDIADLVALRKTNPEASHFTGTLVLDIGAVTTESTQLLVVDGQQRLTTLSTLLAAIANEWERLGETTAAKRIREQVLVNAFAVTTDARYRLRPANFDEEVYRSVVEGKPIKSSNSFIDDAYFFFEKQLRNLEPGVTLSDIENAVQLGLKFVSITAKNDDNVYRIFESINNTGVALSQADLIKNLVFMELGSDSERIHATLWNAIQKDLSAEDIENLFWIEAQWRNPLVRKLDIYEDQKSHVKDFNTEQLISYLENALAIADAIRLARLTVPEVDQEVRLHLARLASLEYPGLLVLITRILYLRNKDVISSEDAASALAIIESYMVRRVIMLVPVSNLSKIAAYVASSLHGDAAKEVHKLLSTGRRSYQKDSTILASAPTQMVYSGGRAKQMKQILSWLLQSEQGKDSIDFSSMTIEHVLPQTLTGEARAEFARTLHEGEDPSELHEQLVHTLGNLTLTNYNSELSNNAFSVKRSERLLKTGVLANQEIAASEVWGPEQIRQRSLKLAQDICRLWAGPDEALLELEPATVGDRIDDLIASIPRGKWTSYGAIANVLGTASQVVGNRITRGSQEGAWRVLRANGEIAPGFKWAANSPNQGKDLREVLESEGVRFNELGLAFDDDRFGEDDLAAFALSDDE